MTYKEAFNTVLNFIESNKETDPIEMFEAITKLKNLFEKGHKKLVKQNNKIFSDTLLERFSRN